MRLLLGVVFVVSCIFPVNALAKELRICGTGDSQDLLRELGDLFEEQHPDTRVIVPESIGSSGGVKATVAGKCDLARLARPLKDKEKAHGLSSLVFSHSPVVMVVNESVTGLDSLTVDEIIGIYSGRISNWQELGAPAAPIYVANREWGDSSRSVLARICPALPAWSSRLGQRFTPPLTRFRP